MTTAFASASAPVLSSMTPAQAFARDGYLLMRNLLPAARLLPVRAAIDARVAAIRTELLSEGIELPPPASTFSWNLMPLGEHLMRYGRSWTEALAGSAVYHLHQAPELLDVVQELIGPQICGHKQFNLRPKLPGQELTTVPWHQDGGYYDPRLKDDTVLTVWMPLVPANAHNGCLQLVPGSHRTGALEHDTDVGEGKFLQVRATPDPASVMTVEMEPGDALIMHNLTWHCSTQNHSDGIRWSIDLRFYAAGLANASLLSCGFPRPWIVRGGQVTPLSEWESWYL